MATKFKVEVKLALPDQIDWSNADKALENIAYDVQEAIKIRLRGRSQAGLERPYDYRGWKIKRLAEKTKNDKLREGYTEVYDVPLIRTGEMVGAIRFRRIRERLFELYLSSGRNANLARWHQDEGIGRKKIRRPFLGMTKDDIARAEARLIRWARTIGKDIKVRRHIIRY